MNLELSNLAIGYKNNPILTGINQTAKDGELISIIGPNGSGKTTLLKTMAGLKRPQQGTIKMNGNEIQKLSKIQLARMVSIVLTQNVFWGDLSVQDVVGMGRLPYTNWMGKKETEDYNVISKYANLVKIEKFMNKRINELSDGERERVIVAKSLVQDTPLLLLDEPTSYLDFENRFLIIDMLRDIAHEEQKTIVISTQELNIALQMSDKIWCINENRLYSGTAEQIERQGILEKMFRNIAYDAEAHQYEYALHRRDRIF